MFDYLPTSYEAYDEMVEDLRTISESEYNAERFAGERLDHDYDSWNPYNPVHKPAFIADFMARNRQFGLRVRKTGQRYVFVNRIRPAIRRNAEPCPF